MKKHESSSSGGAPAPDEPDEPAAASARAADAIVHKLEALIADGKLADGQPIPIERDLMAQYGASRTVIREAITTLTTKGFLENRNRYRPIVRKPSLDSALHSIGGIVMHLLKQPGGVENLYGVRVFAERMLVRDAAEHASRSDIQRLKQALAANEAAIPHSALYYQSDMAFHAELYNIAGNPALPVIHQAYTTWLSPYWLRMKRSPERNQMNHDHHKGIYFAILERDPDLAEERMDTHLRIAWEHVSLTFDIATDDDHSDKPDW